MFAHGAIIAVFALVVSAVLQLDSGLPDSLLRLLQPIGATLAVAAAAERIGGWIGRLARVGLVADERYLVGSVALALIAPIAGFLAELPALPLALTLIALALLRSPRSYRRSYDALRTHPAPRAILDHSPLLCMILLLSALWNFLTVLAPPIGSEMLPSRIGIAMQWIFSPRRVFLLAGGAWNLADTFPVPYLLLDPEGISANLAGALLLLSAAASASRIADASGIRGRLIAALTVLTAPLVTALAAASSEVPLALALLLAAAALTIRSDSGSPGRRALISAGLAGVAAIVAPGQTIIALPFLGLLWYRMPGNRLPRLAALVCGLAPFPLLRLALSHALAREAATFLPAGSTPPLLTLPVSPLSDFDATIGPLLALLPLLAVRRRSGERDALTLSAIAWISLRDYSLVPLASTLVLASAIGLQRLHLRPRFDRLLPLAALLLLGANVASIERGNKTLMLHAGSIDRPFYCISRVESYLLQTVGAKDLPADARVLSIGEHRLHFLRRAAWQPPAAVQTMLSSPDPVLDSERLRTTLIEAGFTHLLILPRPEDGYGPHTALARLVERCTTVIRRDDSLMGLYALERKETP